MTLLAGGPRKAAAVPKGPTSSEAIAKLAKAAVEADDRAAKAAEAYRHAKLDARWAHFTLAQAVKRGWT